MNHSTPRLLKVSTSLQNQLKCIILSKSHPFKNLKFNHLYQVCLWFWVWSVLVQNSFPSVDQNTMYFTCYQNTMLDHAWGIPVVGTLIHKGRKWKDKISHQFQTIVKSSEVSSICVRLGKNPLQLKVLHSMPSTLPSESSFLFHVICKWIELPSFFLSTEFYESENFVLFSLLCPFQYKILIFLLIFSKTL